MATVPGAPKRPNGRPTKLTPELQARLVAILRAGNYVETACDLVGISRECFYHWCEIGAKAEGCEKSFSDTSKDAMAQAESDALAAVQSGVQSWQARAWFLERRHRDRYGRSDRVELVITPAAIQAEIDAARAAGEEGAEELTVEGIQATAGKLAGKK